MICIIASLTVKCCLRQQESRALIVSAFLKERWNAFRSVLEENDYDLIDEHEHTFQKDGVCYSYAELEDLEAFAQIRLSDIECKCENGVQFRVLSLEQYLKVYTASSKDGYRINVRQKKDADKILFIEKHILEQTDLL